MTDPAATVRQPPFDCPLPKIPKCLELRTVTKGMMTYAEAQQLGYRHAGHVLLWAPQEGSSPFGELRAAVMMHLRFDGSFGFPGGLIDDGEDVVEGLNRELVEEIGWQPQEHPITWHDYYCTQVEDSKLLVLNFFIKKLTLDQMVALESRCPHAKEYGLEVFGTVRVPLYTMHNNYNGLPAFLNNKFCGTAKQQLLLSLYREKILSEEEIAEVILKSQNLKLAPNRF